MSRILGIISAVSLGAALSFGSVNAHAAMIGDTVHARFFGLDQYTVDSDAGTFVVANGTSFTFSDDIGFGTYMQVTFSNNQITLTNLIAGIFPDYTAADFEFMSGPALTAVTIDPSSSSMFAPGSILSANSYNIHLNLSNTCELCVGGESIVLNVTSAVPEPATMALFSAGVLAVAWRRRRVA